MAIFTVTFQLQSRHFDNEQFNLVDTIQKEYEVESLAVLKKILNKPEELESIDDFSVFNAAIIDPPDEVKVSYVLIEDEQGKELFRDPDYISAQ